MANDDLMWACVCAGGWPPTEGALAQPMLCLLMLPMGGAGWRWVALGVSPVLSQLAASTLIFAALRCRDKTPL